MLFSTQLPEKEKTILIEDHNDNFYSGELTDKGVYIPVFGYIDMKFLKAWRYA